MTGLWRWWCALFECVEEVPPESGFAQATSLCELEWCMREADRRPWRRALWRGGRPTARAASGDQERSTSCA